MMLLDSEKLKEKNVYQNRTEAQHINFNTPVRESFMKFEAQTNRFYISEDRRSLSQLLSLHHQSKEGLNEQQDLSQSG